MADPATIAMAAKAAIAAATDKKTWQTIAVIIGVSVAVLLLPLMLITCLLSGGAEQNKTLTQTVFDGGALPSDLSPEHRAYMERMQEAFAKLDVEIPLKNAELTGGSLDNNKIKAVFYCIYYGKDFSALDDAFYKNFVGCFVKEDGGNKIPITDMQAVYANVSTLTGTLLTDVDVENINSLYNYIKYGYAGVPNFNGIPGAALADASFAALMSEATKYIGYPYAWGGSSPQTSFDCSGFVCWSYTKSGVRNLPRTTAQGLYDQCIPVAKADAKPGDLVFFTKTYDSPNPVTHVGIFVGDGKVLDAGDPIGIHDLNNSWYRQHFYSFGRLN